MRLLYTISRSLHSHTHFNTVYLHILIQRNPLPLGTLMGCIFSSITIKTTTTTPTTRKKIISQQGRNSRKPQNYKEFPHVENSVTR